MRLFITLLSITVFFLGGCSSKGENIATEPTPSSNEEEWQGEEDSDEKEPAEEVESSENEVLGKLDEVVIPSNLEEFVAVQSGTMTGDMEYKEETSMWPSLNPLSGLEEEFLLHMENVTKETTDSEDLMKAFIHLLGNNAYPETIGKLANYEPSFNEPLLPEPELNDEAPNGQGTPAKALILLDASSSMLLDVDGKQKMKVAKDAVLSFGKTIGANSDVSLYVYGHAGSQEDKDMQVSCTTIDEVYPAQAYNEKAFFEAVQGVEAKGWTPLAEAIKTAREDSADYDGDITLYIVSDGMETCEGNPVEEARAFADEKEGRHVNIIGFNVDKQSEDQLKDVAAAGNGEYISADSADDLQNSMKYKWLPDSLDLMNKSLASPKGTFAVAFANLDLDNMKMAIQNAINKETERFRAAATSLKNAEQITEEEKAALLARIEEYGETMRSLTEELHDKKDQEMNDELDRIDAEIKDWIERMKKLKEENG
ncbi:MULTISPECIES: VWA domain-containing protein [unclassified Sutcliffiella]|uniref:VWA domain-containing protein n=1 Tax=unclassified Sutcliffiella TaxID=2837532 RepID=UPI0030CCF7F1